MSRHRMTKALNSIDGRRGMMKKGEYQTKLLEYATYMISEWLRAGFTEEWAKCLKPCLRIGIGVKETNMLYTVNGKEVPLTEIKSLATISILALDKIHERMARYLGKEMLEASQGVTRYLRAVCDHLFENKAKQNLQPLPPWIAHTQSRKPNAQLPQVAPFTQLKSTSSHTLAATTVQGKSSTPGGSKSRYTLSEGEDSESEGSHPNLAAVDADDDDLADFEDIAESRASVSFLTSKLRPDDKASQKESPSTASRASSAMRMTRDSKGHEVYGIIDSDSDIEVELNGAGVDDYNNIEQHHNILIKREKDLASEAVEEDAETAQETLRPKAEPGEGTHGSGEANVIEQNMRPGVSGKKRKTPEGGTWDQQSVPRVKEQNQPEVNKNKKFLMMVLEGVQDVLKYSDDYGIPELRAKILQYGDENLVVHAEDKKMTSKPSFTGLIGTTAAVDMLYMAATHSQRQEEAKWM